MKRFGKHARTCYDKYHHFDRIINKVDYYSFFLNIDGYNKEKAAGEYVQSYAAALAMSRLGANVNKALVNDVLINQRCKANADKFYVYMKDDKLIMRIIKSPNFLIAPEEWPYDLADLFPEDLEPWELANQMLNQNHPKIKSFSTAVLVWYLSGIPTEIILETFSMTTSEHKTILIDAVKCLRDFFPMRLWIANVDIEQVPVYCGVNSFIESMEYRTHYYASWYKMHMNGFMDSFFPDHLENDPLTTLPLRPQYSRKIYGTLVVSPPYIR